MTVEVLMETNVQIAAFFALGCLFLMIGMIVWSHYRRFGHCDHEWVIAGKVDVIGSDPNLPDAFIHIRGCNKCKLIHQQKVCN